MRSSHVQKDILHTAAAYLKAGGILVYSTCTLNKKENENQVAVPAGTSRRMN
jgi:16S rRNA (cytosine967-C5)-methyltransferase